MGIELKELTIAQLANKINRDWEKPYFGAVPYIAAMATCHQLDPKSWQYGFDDGKGIVLYFLSNARTWKGDTARAVKAELKRRCK